MYILQIPPHIWPGHVCPGLGQPPQLRDTSYNSSPPSTHRVYLSTTRKANMEFVGCIYAAHPHIKPIIFQNWFLPSTLWQNTSKYSKTSSRFFLYFYWFYLALSLDFLYFYSHCSFPFDSTSRHMHWHFSQSWSVWPPDEHGCLKALKARKYITGQRELFPIWEFSLERGWSFKIIS